MRLLHHRSILNFTQQRSLFKRWVSVINCQRIEKSVLVNKPVAWAGHFHMSQMFNWASLKKPKKKQFLTVKEEKAVMILMIVKTSR